MNRPPKATMKRKLRKVGRTGGMSSLAKSERPFTSALASPKAIQLIMLGMGRASMAFLPFSWSGHTKTYMGAFFWVVQWDSMAAILAGWSLATFMP